MTVKVEYGAQVRVAAGTAAESVALESGPGLRGLLALLAERHGKAFRDLILDGAGNPRSSNLVLVNDQMVRWDAAPPLHDGDVVAILSPIAGG